MQGPARAAALLIALSAAFGADRAAGQARETGTSPLESRVAYALPTDDEETPFASVGDLDGDGHGDVAIADVERPKGSPRGIRILLAGTGPPGTRSIRIRAGSDLRVEGLAGVGDVDGDGLADLALSTAIENVPALARAVGLDIGRTPTTPEGATVVVFGSRALPEEIDLRLLRRDAAAFATPLRGPVAGAGDVNGDGLADVVTGVGEDDEADSEEERTPRLVVAFGRRGLRGAVDRVPTGLRLVGRRSDAGFGLAVAAAGDVDGDGLGDVLVGVPFAADRATRDEEVLTDGLAYVVYGRRNAGAIDLAKRAVATRITTRRTSVLGFAVAGPGDFDGDGLADVALGAPVRSRTRASALGGAVFVVPGSRARPTTIDLDAGNPRVLRLDGEAFDLAGIALGAPGDVDGDGRPDLLVGRSSDEEFAPEGDAAGAVDVVFGGRGPGRRSLGTPGADLRTLRGGGVEEAGAGLATGADLDADGRPEVLVRRPQACRLGLMDSGGDVAGVELTGPATVAPGRGTDAADRLFGTRVGDDLRGLGGDDDLRAGDGHDCVLGGDGSDRLSGGTTTDAIFGEAGADLLFGDSGCDRLFGGLGDDVIRAGPERATPMSILLAPRGSRDRDEAEGGAGDDTIAGGLDRDRLDGGPGADRIGGGVDRDLLEGGLGADVLAGDGGDDRLFGDTEGSDFDEDLPGFPVRPRDGADRLSGGAGADVLSGGEGRDVLQGGPGNDRIEARDGERDVVSCGSGRRDVARVDRGDRVSGCERVRRPAPRPSR